jgi:hypothetical protein
MGPLLMKHPLVHLDNDWHFSLCSFLSANVPINTHHVDVVWTCISYETQNQISFDLFLDEFMQFLQSFVNIIYISI